MAERKAVYFVVPDGYTVVEALVSGKLVAGPCDTKLAAMGTAKVELGTDDAGRYNLVKAHFDNVSEFNVAPVTVAAFTRS